MISYIYKVIIIILIIILSFKFRNNSDVLEYPTLLLNSFKDIFDKINIKNNLDYFYEKTKIENIFILLSIFPFLKKEIRITKQNPLFHLYQQIFNVTNDKIIKLNKNNKTIFPSNFKNLLHYKWEILPEINITNYLRHILYHYYPEQYLNIYEDSLNLNIKFFINDNINRLSYDSISDLMSKLNNI